MDPDLLGNIPLFAKLSKTELAALGTHLKEEKFENQKPVFWIGEDGSDFYIIQLGRAAVCYPDDAGREITIAVLGPGDFFGEISLLDGGPRTATIRAEGDLRVLTLSRRDFLDFLRGHPDASVHILTILGQRQRDILEKLRGVKNVNEVMEQRATRWQKIADVIAAISASQAFVITHVAWFGVWMIANAIAGSKAFDPFPFGLLTMVVSLEAIFLSIFVLISQNRSGEKDRVRADLDYQVNLRAHLAIMQLHQKIDRIENAFITVGGEELRQRLAAAPTSATERMLATTPDGKREA